MKQMVIILLLSLLVVVPNNAQEGQTSLSLTIEDCVARAKANNYARQAVALDAKTDSISLNKAKNELLPTFSAGITEGVTGSNGDGSWNGSYDLSANLTLFQGGQLVETIKQSKLQIEQTEQETRQYDNQLTIQVLQQFLTALSNEELLKCQSTLVETSCRQMEEGRVQQEAGEILESDYLLLKAQYATDQHNVAASKINLDNSLVSLKNLLGLDMSTEIQLVYPQDSTLCSLFLIPTQEEVVSRGLATMPDLQISKYAIQIAQAGMKISKAGYYPTVSLGAGVSTGHSKTFRNYGSQLADRFVPQASLSVSIPIYNHSQTRSAVAKSKVALQQAQLNHQQSVLDVEQTLLSEYGTLLSSRSEYVAKESKRQAYSSSFEAYRAMFSAGSITVVELLQQQNNYISALNEYVQSKYTFLLQRKALDVYMGEEIIM